MPQEVIFFQTCNKSFTVEKSRNHKYMSCQLDKVSPCMATISGFQQYTTTLDGYKVDYPSPHIRQAS